MKTIKFIFICLLALLLIACAGVFIFLETFDADQYLSQITGKASRALGRPVYVGHVGLGLSSQGITLDAAPLTIADDQGFTTQPFIKIDRVRISVDLRSLILQREIHITGVLLQSPQIHFIRSQEGSINVRSIAQPGQGLSGTVNNHSLPLVGRISEGKERPTILFHPHPTAPIKGEGYLFPAINIKSIKIQDASISFIDQNQVMPLDVWLRNINADLDGFSLSRPFQLSFDASPLVFKSISPGVPDSPVFKDITGAVELNAAHPGAGISGGFTADGDLTITDGVIKNFNIIKTVLSHTLGNFGGMDGRIENILNGRLKDKLGADDTRIDKVEAKFSFHDKAVFIDDLLIDTDILELTAKGPVDQGFNIDMQTMLRLNADVSAALANELEGLKYLMDDSKRIAIGASLKGTIPHLKYKPDKDFRKKSRKMFIEEGGNILSVLLGGGQTSSQGPDAPSQDAGKKKKIKFKDILNNFLH